MGKLARTAYGLGGVAAAVVGAGAAAASAITRADRRRNRPVPTPSDHPLSGPTTSSASTVSAVPEPEPEAEPFRERDIPTHDGGMLHILESGPSDGRPLVLLHGVTLRAELWTHQLRELGDTYRVVAPDWRGHGRSTCGSDGYGLRWLALDLAAVLNHLELERAIVVGHSMGGMALMRFCRDRPDVLYRRVSGVVFVSTAANKVGAGVIGTLFRVLNRFAEAKPELVDHVPVRAPGDLGYALSRLGFGREPIAEDVERTRGMLADMSSSAAGRSVAALIDHDETPTLRSLDLPALVLVGTNDLLTPEWQARDIAAAIPSAELVVFDRAGHLLMLERRERFNAVLREFADRTGQPDNWDT